MNRISTSIALVFALAVVGLNQNALGSDFLDLIVPVFQVREENIEVALRKLRTYGLAVCLEQSLGAPVRFSVSVKNASIRDILNELVAADPSYSWSVYAGVWKPSTLEVVNVFPKTAEQDPEQLTNLEIDSVQINHANPVDAIPTIYALLPELRERYFQVVPRGGAISQISPLTPPSESFFLDLTLKRATVREVLNEITIRSGGVCWKYERSKVAPQHMWRVFY